MRLTEASVAIRPRTPWEAMDLGILLARQHRRLLMTSWAIVTLPFFILLSLALWDYPSLTVFLLWWLKPAFERLPLYILSKALFGETPTLKQALREWPRQLKPQLLASLTWRRLSLSRSFTLPVTQLEGLNGQPRQQRIAVLRQRNSQSARWLTLIGIHLETVLWIGLIGLMYLFIPQQLELEWDWAKWLTNPEQEVLWFEHLSNLLYAVVLLFWEPIYVACGFSLYLNRRTVLEAWDIELVFRRLRQRLSGAVAGLLIIAGVLLLPSVQPAWAAEPVDSPKSPRLQQQALNSQDAQKAIQSLIKAPPFENPETVERWRLKDKAKDPKAKTDDKKPPTWLKQLLDSLGKHSFGGIAQLIEVLLWALLAALIALLMYRYRDWLLAFVGRRRVPNVALRPQPPQQLFGLEIGTETLPTDIASSAERLWAEQPREALGLLYRGLLNRLLDDFRLPLKNADTEGQVLERIRLLQQPALQAFSEELTRHWQNLAYGHRLPPAHLQQQLCDGWRQLFGNGAQP